MQLEQLDLRVFRARQAQQVLKAIRDLLEQQAQQVLRELKALQVLRVHKDLKVPVYKDHRAHKELQALDLVNGLVH